MTTSDQNIELTHKNQLVEYFELGNKPPERWGVGTEHEKFLYRLPDLKRLDFDSDPGIRQILEEIQSFGWEPLTEQGQVIGLTKKGGSITLEPGGQFELSGRNFSTIHETYRETKKHFEKLNLLSEKYGIINLAMGFDPLWKRQDMPWMPKERYRYMKAYMPLKGNLGLDMMTRTATIQVNLDYRDENDMVKKLRMAQAVQPIVTALFANSPFSEGQPNGYLSYRARVWDDTDPDRCGFLPFIFDQGFGFERWVDYLLDIPMYFIYRNGQYIPCNNITFREFMQGRHLLKPTLQDWDTHVATAFPDVRLKRFIEMRGADASCVAHISALGAFWAGLFYDAGALDSAYSLTQEWDIETIREVRRQVPKLALKAAHGNLNAWDAARRLIEISSAGLSNRSNALGIENENRYLEPIVQIAESGITQAERHLENYHNHWRGNLAGMIRSVAQPKTSLSVSYEQEEKPV